MTATAKGRVLLEAGEIDRTIARLAHEIVEPADAQSGLLLVGIRRGGEALAIRIAAKIGAILGREPTLGFLNINLYRDDDVSHALPESQIPVDVAGRTVVLVDDVLFTGRTIRSALDALTDFGRPAAIRLCCLIDRGSRELPIQPDYVGREIPSGHSERIAVNLASEASPSDEVTIRADAP
ncbi:MAG: bifunctional pyr operon transcriptional regulator/uracil phosphoribosyltransferase PyrR [Candidatus Eremiobacteraeota bacterium]|nr:bifunctional pyr operon transcriptional regulator/uracil phosphoribosyltransferase PyrR [Candidatus Eremiobacteraeota bacterium]